MPAPRPILCLSFPAWEGDYTKSTVELVKPLAALRPVLFVDYAYTWKDALWGMLGRHPHIPWQRVLGWQPRLRRTGEGLLLWSLPPTLPANSLPAGRAYRWAMRWNSFWLRRSIRQALRQAGFEAPIVLNAFLPTYGLLLQGAFGEAATIYYCYDEIGAADWAAKHGAPAEAAYVQRVDGLVFSSQALLRKKAPAQKPARCVPNGVAPHFLAAPLTGPQAGARPIVGYVGSIDERLDWAMLEHAFAALPDCDFHFVGRINGAGIGERLAAFPNVQWLGAQAYEALPQFLARFTLGIIPFRQTDFTAGIYPMKVNEYLAAGLPVVSTAFGDMAEFRHIVRLVADAPGFVAALRAALAEDSPSARAERRAFAAQQTWPQRAAALSAFLDDIVEGKT